jgi:hypothetical protein
MSWDGHRWAMLDSYGSLDPKRIDMTIGACLAAWGVVEKFDIDKYKNQKAAVGYASHRSFMLKFRDGKWRYAGFGGSAGPPCASCQWEGYEGKTGEHAYLAYCIEHKTKHVQHAKEKYEHEQHELDKLLQIKKMLEE